MPLHRITLSDPFFSSNCTDFNKPAVPRGKLHITAQVAENLAVKERERGRE
jgi:hypothetical protein